MLTVGICTVFGDPQFSSSIPPEVKKQGKGRIIDVCWFSAGAVNEESAGKNGYYVPDLPTYKRLGQRAAKLLKDQPGPKIVQLDMEDVPLEPGHTGESAEHVTRGAPTWRMWRGERPDKKCATPAEGRERVAYGYEFFAPCAATVKAVTGIEPCIYAGDIPWFDRPPPKSWEEECDYRAMQAVRDNFLLKYVKRLCIDVYAWHAPDGNHTGLWDSDFDAKLRLLPAGVAWFPELFFFWNDREPREYIGDDFVRHQLDGCRRRGCEFVSVFEPPEQAWKLLLEFTGN